MSSGKKQQRDDFTICGTPTRAEVFVRGRRVAVCCPPPTGAIKSPLMREFFEQLYGGGRDVRKLAHRVASSD
jgi:hypothetical protein